MRGRACPIHICDFNHLSLAEVREHEELSKLAKNRKLSAQEKARFLQLDQRRLIVPTDDTEDVA